MPRIRVVARVGCGGAGQVVGGDAGAAAQLAACGDEGADWIPVRDGAKPPADGTKALETMAMGKVSGSRASAVVRFRTRSRGRRRASRGRSPSGAAARRRLRCQQGHGARQPMASPAETRTVSCSGAGEQPRTCSPEGHGAAGDGHGPGSVHDPLGGVVGGGHGCGAGCGDHGEGEQAGDEVFVVAAAWDGDGATEDVSEQDDQDGEKGQT